MRDEIKLTKLAKCAGCGAKVGAGILAQLLGDIRVRQDENLLVGFDKSDVCILPASFFKILRQYPFPVRGPLIPLISIRVRVIVSPV